MWLLAHTWYMFTQKCTCTQKTFISSGRNLGGRRACFSDLGILPVLLDVAWLYFRSCPTTTLSISLKFSLSSFMHHCAHFFMCCFAHLPVVSFFLTSGVHSAILFCFVLFLFFILLLLQWVSKRSLNHRTVFVGFYIFQVLPRPMLLVCYKQHL